MKTINLKGWAAVDDRGDVMWVIDENGNSMPLCAVSKPTKKAMRAHGAAGIEPIDVTITAAKQKRAKRRNP